MLSKTINNFLNFQLPTVTVANRPAKFASDFVFSCKILVHVLSLTYYIDSLFYF